MPFYRDLCALTPEGTVVPGTLTSALQYYYLTFSIDCVNCRLGTRLGSGALLGEGCRFFDALIAFFGILFLVAIRGPVCNLINQNCLLPVTSPDYRRQRAAISRLIGGSYCAGSGATPLFVRPLSSILLI